MATEIKPGALAAAAAQPAPEAPQAEMPPEAAAGPEAGDQELFDLAVGRVLEVLAKGGEEFDMALRADPVQAAVGYGTSAVHVVAESAEEAGKPIPFEILVQVGMQIIKEIAAVANDKGYLPDEQIEVFLKEAFQQSLAKYAELDAKAGKLQPEMLEQMRAALGGAAPAPAGGTGALAQMAGGGV